MALMPFSYTLRKTMKTFPHSVRSGISALLVLMAASAQGADAYIVRFNASGKISQGWQAIWTSDLLLYNQKSTPAEIRLLGVSNGQVETSESLVREIPPRQVSSLNRNWAPAGSPRPEMWVMHVEVPEGVTIDARDIVTYRDTIIPDSLPTGIYTKVSLPVIKALTPPGVEQIKLGTDLGSTPTRQNVAIYNAGSQLANATVEVRRACDDFVVDRRAVTVNPNSIIQVNGLSTGTTTCTPLDRAAGYVRYTVIVVDQPSFSIVSSVTEAQPQAPGDVLPLVELAIAMNAVF